MELHIRDCCLRKIPAPSSRFSGWRPAVTYLRNLRRQSSSSNHLRVGTLPTPEQPGGKLMVELVGVFNELAERMNMSVLSTSSSRLLFKALKLSIPILVSLPLAPDGRSPLSKALSVAIILADLQAKHLKAIMMAAAELAALRLKDLPSPNHKNLEIDQRDQVFCLLDKNGDGKISIEELVEVMEELGAQGEDALEMMQLLDSNSDGSLSSDEFDLFQKQVELMRNLEDRDDQYKTLLDNKLGSEDNRGAFHVQKDLGKKIQLISNGRESNEF